MSTPDENSTKRKLLVL